MSGETAAPNVNEGLQSVGSGLEVSKNTLESGNTNSVDSSVDLSPAAQLATEYENTDSGLAIGDLANKDLATDKQEVPAVDSRTQLNNGLKEARENIRIENGKRFDEIGNEIGAQFDKAGEKYSPATSEPDPTSAAEGSPQQTPPGEGEQRAAGLGTGAEQGDATADSAETKSTQPVNAPEIPQDTGRQTEPATTSVDKDQVVDPLKTETTGGAVPASEGGSAPGGETTTDTVPGNTDPEVGPAIIETPPGDTVPENDADETKAEVKPEDEGGTDAETTVGDDEPMGDPPEASPTAPEGGPAAIDDEPVGVADDEVEGEKGAEDEVEAEDAESETDEAKAEAKPEAEGEADDKPVSKEGRQKRIEELKSKDNLDPDELQELYELKVEADEENRLNFLVNKLKTEGLSPDEFEELKRRNTEKAVETEALTPEQEAELTQQKLEDLKETMYKEFGEGNFEDAAKHLLEYNDELAKSLGFDITKNSEQTAKNFLEGLIDPNKAAGPKETAKMRAVRDKLQELGQMEMQIRQQAEIVKQMEEKEKDYKQRVNDTETEYVKANDAEKTQKYMAFSQASMQLASYQGAITEKKSAGRQLTVKRREVRGFIHRKLKTHTFVYNAFFGAGSGAQEMFFAAADAAENAFDN